MGNRLITLFLLVLVVLVFVFYFIVQKNIFPSGGQPIKGFFVNIINDAEQNRWDEAKKKADELVRVWEKKKYVVMFNYSEADYQIFADTVYRLSTAVETKEIYQTVSQAKMGLKLWENFLKIVPEP